MNGIEERFIDINECRMRCLVAPGSKQSVFLLHGASFTADDWAEIGTLDLLSENDYRFVALDIPGFGKSDKCSLDPTTLLRKIIDETGMDRPVLIGPSMGGGIALSMAVHSPELVGGLILIGAVSVKRFADSLNRIQVPTLIVWGSRDTVSPLSNARILQEGIHGSEVIIVEDAPHPCYLEKTDQWHEMLLVFLEKKF